MILNFFLSWFNSKRLMSINNECQYALVSENWSKQKIIKVITTWQSYT